MRRSTGECFCQKRQATPFAMSRTTDDAVRSLIGQLRSAINRHDLDAFLECFDEAYESEQPLDPERSFRGREGVRRNWSANLARVPDLRWDLLDASFTADAAWCEWRWHGNRAEGGRFDMQGVVIYGVEAGRIVRGRLYMRDAPRKNGTAPPT
jgi:ketosteroid isomerase-like protein